MATTLIDPSDIIATLDAETVVLESTTEYFNKCSSALNSHESTPLDELTPEQVQTIADSGDFATLHSRSKQIGVQVMKFITFWEKYKPIIAAMRAKFAPRRGSHCRTEVEPGVSLTWAEYCVKYFNVSYRWVTQLMNGDYVAIANEAGVETANSNCGEPHDGDPLSTIERKVGKKDKLIAQLQEHVKTLTGKLNVLQPTTEVEQLSEQISELQSQLVDEKRKNEELSVTVSEIDNYSHELEDQLEAASPTVSEEWSGPSGTSDDATIPAASSEVIAYFAELKSDAQAFATELRFLVRQHGLSAKIDVQLM